jgi:hypothetical protein
MNWYLKLRGMLHVTLVTDNYFTNSMDWDLRSLAQESGLNQNPYQKKKIIALKILQMSGKLINNQRMCSLFPWQHRFFFILTMNCEIYLFSLT